MEIIKTNIKEQGSCNFCKRGKLRKNGQGLEYPYKVVYTMTSGKAGGGLLAVVCEQCIGEIEKECCR